MPASLKDADSIKALVTKLVHREVRNLRLVDVLVDDEEDTDGNKLFKIDVIFEGNPNELDPRNLTSVLRHLRSTMVEQNQFAFPLLSFISQKDLSRRKRAPA